MHAAGRAVVWAAVVFFAYEILEDSPIPDELVAGAVIAVVAALVAVRLYDVCTTRYAARWSELRRFAGVPWAMLRDTGVVALCILRSVADRDALQGKMQHLPMDFGNERDPNDAARRALVTYGTCLAPNTVVCLVDRRGLYLHRLAGSSRPPKDVRWPI